MNVQATILTGHARTIESAVEAWQAHHNEAMPVRDLESIADLVLIFARYLVEVQAMLFDDLSHDRTTDLELINEQMLRFYEMVDTYFAKFTEANELVARRGYTIAQADQVAQLSLRLKELREQWRRGWPVADPASWQRSREEIAAGKYKTLRELISERRSKRS